MYKINLLPAELQRDLSIDVKGLVRRVTVTIMVILLLFGYGAFLFMGYLTQKEISDTERYLSQISATVKKVEGIKNEESTRVFKELLNARQSRFPLLEDISYNMPVDLWLGNVDISYVAPKNAGKDGQPGQPSGNESSGYAQGQPVTATQSATEKNGVDSLPLPNTLIIVGYARSVPSIGFFMNNLYRMPYFSNVFLNELQWDEKEECFKFKLTAELKEGGR
ncbi:Fimbrial assembly protein (PilN) [Pelotomaculum schinkii]|uniref:Fimbrial assembly protein (PilN) n=1 Tax=Pelotomaculum schinkii TaxID=78350 RepID=A0A4Y7RC92_9FIRM|nr:MULTISPECIES: PilN domain-containing protein [Pelotomaculum]TEB06638.1 Fimbrial assembly protein (PilN) [Pelotomaculum schinkii]TEB17567.1 Fimbrial assembly protein (PilN) [Pelotomaculum sp. FP]